MQKHLSKQALPANSVFTAVEVQWLILNHQIMIIFQLNRTKNAHRMLLCHGKRISTDFRSVLGSLLLERHPCSQNAIESFATIFVYQLLILKQLLCHISTRRMVKHIRVLNYYVAQTFREIVEMGGLIEKLERSF